MAIYAPAQGYGGGGGSGITAIDQTILNGSITPIKTANESVSNSTTLQDDDHLVVNVLDGNTYKVTVVLRASSSGTGGFQFALGGTAAFASGGIGNGFMADIGGNVFTDVAAASLIQGTAFLSHTPGAAMVYDVVITACFAISGGSGTVVLQWAQNSAQALSSTLLARSYMTVQRVI